MVAQRRRANQLATTWIRSPRMNYSRITPEACMMMTKASRVNSPFGRVPGRASDPSRSRDGDDGGYRLFRGILIGSLGFLYRRHLIGERGGRGGALGGHTTPWRGPGLVARPGGVAALWPLFVSYFGSVSPSVKN